MEKDATMKWLLHTDDPDGRYYTSEGGRWLIFPPKRSASRRFELIDSLDDRWFGDWPTLREAKERAQQLSRSR